MRSVDSRARRTRHANDALHRPRVASVPAAGNVHELGECLELIEQGLRNLFELPLAELAPLESA